MRFTVRTSLLALTLVALTVTVSACAKRHELSANSPLNEDDDTFCRANNVAAGSPEYVACRKDRDVQRGNAIVRTEKKQRELGEYMLNNPVRP